MGLLELFILAVGLSMDAFAVSVCKGLSVKKMEPKHALICGAYFGHLFVHIYPVGFDHHVLLNTDLLQNHRSPENSAIVHILEQLKHGSALDVQIHPNNGW